MKTVKAKFWYSQLMIIFCLNLSIVSAQFGSSMPLQLDGQPGQNSYTISSRPSTTSPNMTNFCYSTYDGRFYGLTSGGFVQTANSVLGPWADFSLSTVGVPNELGFITCSRFNGRITAGYISSSQASYSIYDPRSSINPGQAIIINSKQTRTSNRLSDNFQSGRVDVTDHRLYSMTFSETNRFSYNSGPRIQLALDVVVADPMSPFFNSFELISYTYSQCSDAKLSSATFTVDPRYDDRIIMFSSCNMSVVVNSTRNNQNIEKASDAEDFPVSVVPDCSNGPSNRDYHPNCFSTLDSTNRFFLILNRDGLYRFDFASKQWSIGGYRPFINQDLLPVTFNLTHDFSRYSITYDSANNIFYGLYRNDVFALRLDRFQFNDQMQQFRQVFKLAEVVDGFVSLEVPYTPPQPPSYIDYRLNFFHLTFVVIVPSMASSSLFLPILISICCACANMKRKDKKTKAVEDE